ncbi:unnamed protein product [Tenebrio molitor]|nr:unnamed protein product [Tenebrio molitor]
MVGKCDSRTRDMLESKYILQVASDSGFGNLHRIIGKNPICLNNGLFNKN